MDCLCRGPPPPQEAASPERFGQNYGQSGQNMVGRGSSDARWRDGAPETVNPEI
jgi:hypothetical protein